MSTMELLSAAARLLPELALKAALVLAVAGAAAHVLRRRSASVRHLVWTTALAGVLFLPLGHLLPLRIAVLPASLGAAPAERVAAPTPAETAAPAASFVEAEYLPAAEPAPLTAPAVAPAVAPEPAWWAGVDRATALIGVWLVVALALVGRLAVGTATVWWLARRGERIDDAEWTAAADRISRTFDAPSARLVRTSWTEMPMTWGFVRPVILLPADCDEWPAERRDVVLRHELAHVARRDVATLVLAQLACAVHWFNPLSWIALHQLRAEAERCCDDWVLSSGTRASTYAGHLLEMVRVIGRARVPSALALPMAQRSTFEGRLLAILEPGVERGAPGRGRAVLTVGGLAAVVALLGALRPADAAPVDAPADAVETAAHAGEHEPPATLPAPAPNPAPALTPAPALPATATAGGGLLEVVSGAVVQGVSEAVRDLKAEAKGRQGAASAVAALTGALADADAAVRLDAVRALGSREDPRSVQALVQALRGDADPEVRRMAAWALGQIEPESAPAELTAALRDEDRAVRLNAAWALGQIGDTAALEGLLRADDPEVRRAAARALGGGPDPRPQPRPQPRPMPRPRPMP